VRPPGEAGWFGQGGAAIKRRDLADLLAGQTDRHRGSAFLVWQRLGERQALVVNLAESRLKQITAQATSRNANHRPQSRSQRTCSRRQQLNQDSDRSIFHRCRPSLVEDSTPRRAIRGLIRRRRRYARLAALS
jgi:hypothetical protein